jgi:hypothetical protein
MPPAGGSRPDLKRAAREHDGRDIELYMDCPRRYLYQTILGLSGSREDNGYVRFHRVLYRILHWMVEQTGTVTAEALQTEIDARWAETGPIDHPLQPLYRASAQKILDQANARSREGIQFGETLIATIDGHAISLSVDEIEKDGRGFVIRRLRTGKAPKKPDHRAMHALMAEAGRQTFGGGRQVRDPLSFVRRLGAHLLRPRDGRQTEGDPDSHHRLGDRRVPGDPVGGLPTLPPLFHLPGGSQVMCCRLPVFRRRRESGWRAEGVQHHRPGRGGVPPPPRRGQLPPRRWWRPARSGGWPARR